MLNDPSLGTLSIAAGMDPLAYAECQAKHAGAVEAYDAVRVAILKANSEAAK